MIYEKQCTSFSLSILTWIWQVLMKKKWRVKPAWSNKSDFWQRLPWFCCLRKLSDIARSFQLLSCWYFDHVRVVNIYYPAIFSDKVLIDSMLSTSWRQTFLLKFYWIITRLLIIHSDNVQQLRSILQYFEVT